MCGNVRGNASGDANGNANSNPSGNLCAETAVKWWSNGGEMSGDTGTQTSADASRDARSVAAAIAGLAARGYAVVPGFLEPAATAALREEAQARDRAGALLPSGVGRGAARVARPGLRGDRILWLDDAAPALAEMPLHAALAALREAGNRELMLGLWRYEGHYALYPPGARYARHVDRFRDDDARVLSCIVYLNADWGPGDGGALRLYVDDGEPLDVPPAAGTLVLFRAERYEHEVLPATRARLAVTGWFCRREPGAAP
jgi:SM-20-related protein